MHIANAARPTDEKSQKCWFTAFEIQFLRKKNNGFIIVFVCSMVETDDTAPHFS